MKKTFLFGLILLAIGCNTADNQINTNCSNVACTEIFVTLFVSVQDNSDNAVFLDNFEVRDIDTNENITLPISESELRFSQLTGEYPIYNDTFVLANQNTQRNLEFNGFVDGNVVAEGEFIVGADCCHVALVSESNIILVN